MADEPRDLSHYDYLTSFSLLQVAHLCVGEDPADPTPGDERWKVVAKALAADDGPWSEPSYIVEGEMPVKYDMGNGEILEQSIPILVVDIGRTIVSREDIALWALRRGLAPKFLERDIAALVKAGAATPAASSKSGAAAMPTTASKPSSPAAGRPRSNDNWISNQDAADDVQCEPETLNRWRLNGYPPLPRAHQFGKYVMYDRAEWEAFAARYRAGEFRKRG